MSKKPFCEYVEVDRKRHRRIEQYQDVELTEDIRMTPGEWLDRWLEAYVVGTVRHIERLPPESRGQAVSARSANTAGKKRARDRLRQDL